MPRLLLSGIFKPYGIDDGYADSLCTMELLNNQVTREQKIHSPRSNNPSFGLYMLAENIEVATTVLDFPSWRGFTREVLKGNYSHIGISFIIPNVNKVKRMTAFIRRYCPDTKIILGGHGVAIPELDEIVEYDDICYGEGISWLRNYFGEDETKPIKHPTMLSAVNMHIYGAPLVDKAGIIIPGVGCQNTCRFCATSHKFTHQQTHFLTTGREIMEVCLRAEKKFGVTDFGILDENFCKMPDRARQFLGELEKEGKTYIFSVFSSAEAVMELGVDFLTRMGVTLIWIGVESRNHLFAKTKGVDVPALIKDLQEHGITVLGSIILFLEHHDKETIHEEIDWAIGLETDLLQFMSLSPMPGTKLYSDYKKEGKLLDTVPWSRQHGQDTIWFTHPEFTLEESHKYLKNAFTKKYHTAGPAVMNIAHTALKGYITAVREIAVRAEQQLQWNPETLKYEYTAHPVPDTFMLQRLEVLQRNALRFRPIFKTVLKYAPNAAAAAKCHAIIELFQSTFGGVSLKDRFSGWFVAASSVIENLRSKKSAIMRQPKTVKVKYRSRSVAQNNKS